MQYRHTPVMLKEVLEFADLKSGNFVIDCTLGGASYTSRFSELVGEEGFVMSFDLDSNAIENAKSILKKKQCTNVELVNKGFDHLEESVENMNLGGKIDAVVMDLGLSSAQLDDRKRGFSFQYDGPLDMTFAGQGQEGNETQEIINYWKEKDLEKIISKYGEERYARRIAKQIVKNRKDKYIKKVSELLEIIEEAVPKSYTAKKGIHFATKTFQALRMASNDELGRLERVLPQALRALKPGGRMICVSFHSLEDRIIKNFFKKESKDCVCPPESPVCICNHKASLKIITKKPLTPSKEEVEANPRSRSAKLRSAEKIH